MFQLTGQLQDLILLSLGVSDEEGTTCSHLPEQLGAAWSSCLPSFWLPREEGTNCSHLPDRFEAAEYQKISFNDFVKGS